MATPHAHPEQNAPVCTRLAPKGLETCPKYFRHHAQTKPQAPAFRYKTFGVWKTWSWLEAWDQVCAIACGLKARGFKAGDSLLIIGDNIPHLYWSMMAAQALGGHSAPIYQDSLPEDIGWLIDHVGARFAVAGTQEYVDKLLAAQNKKTPLTHIFYEDPRGLRHYDSSSVENIHEVIATELATGLTADSPPRERINESVDRGQASDIAILSFTSGTTGRPKGVVLTQENIVETGLQTNAFDNLTHKEDILCYLPMAWIGDHVFSVAQAVVAGFVNNCPESQDTILSDLREIGPTYFFAPPRVFEGLITTVMIRMKDAGRLKQWLFDKALNVAGRVGVDILNKRPVPLLDRLTYQFFDFVIYGPLLDTLGLRRVRLAYTAGEAIGPEIFDFYRSLGLNLKQLYGQTEGTVFIAIQKDGDVSSETVGPPAPWVEVKIEKSGEVLFRSVGAFREYYKNETATQETRTADNWVRTGDAGYIDDAGHLRIIDRAKDVGHTTSGALFAPKYIENKLKFFSNIKESVAFGDGRESVCVFINIDPLAMGNMAERLGIAYSSYQELTSLPFVANEIANHIKTVNSSLLTDPQMKDCIIKRFAVLPKELDADDSELTRTRKVRRNKINERYAPLIEALYNNSSSANISVDVTFEDGTSGRLDATVAVHDVDTHEAPHEIIEEAA